MDLITLGNFHRNPLLLRGLRLKIEDHPGWTIRHTVVNLERSDDRPVTMLLLDRQITPDLSTRYTRMVRRLETPQAVQECGRIEFNFDPATQILLIHAISIFREGKLTNHADLDQINLIQPERDLEQGIYSGSMTALLFASLFKSSSFRTNDT